MTSFGKKAELLSSCSAITSSTEAHHMSDQPKDIRTKGGSRVPLPLGALGPSGQGSAQGSRKRAKDKEKDGRFSLRMSDFALMGDLKAGLRQHGRVVKKSELLRAGLRVLACLPQEAVLSALDELKCSGGTPGPTGRRRRPEGTA
jgi:hypothetical protein